MDCISSIAFGCNCNSLQEPENEFRSQISGDFGPIFVLLSFYVPSLMRFYRVPGKRKNVETFFEDLFNKMVSLRRAEKITRNDFLSSLLQLMDKGEIDRDDGLSSKQTTDSEFKGNFSFSK